MVRFNIESVLAFPREQFWKLRDSQAFINFVVDDGLLKSFKVTDPVCHDDGWMTREQHYCPAVVDCPEFIRPIVGDTMFDVHDQHRWNNQNKPFYLQFQIRPTFLTDLSSTEGHVQIEPFPQRRQKKCHKQKQQDHKNDVDEDENVSSEIDSASDDTTTTTNSNDSDSAQNDDDDDDDNSNNNNQIDSTPNDNKKNDNESPRGKQYQGCDQTDDIDMLPPHEKSIHRTVGHVRVRILTLGWFVERTVAHNLRLFYKHYADTVYRFRCKLYRDFACHDHTVPIGVVVDRLLQHEANSGKTPVVLGMKHTHHVHQMHNASLVESVSNDEHEDDDDVDDDDDDGSCNPIQGQQHQRNDVQLVAHHRKNVDTRCSKSQQTHDFRNDFETVPV